MAEGERRCVRARISGRVQGVGFRAFVIGLGKDLGLSGWISNQPHGEVEVLLEGGRAEVGRAIEAVWRGPLLARVDNVTIEEISPQGLDGPVRVR